LRYTSFLKHATLSALFFAAVFPSAVSAQTDWSVVDYYVYNNMPYSSVNGLWGGITHLAVGDFHVNSSGAISYVFNPGSYFPAAVSAAHANGAKALVILSDTSGSDNLAAAFASNPATLMSNIANIISTYGFDGIQVDWEKSFPYKNTQATLGAFFQALRAKLGNSKLIMADAFAAGGPYGVVSQLQWNTAIESLDRLAIMTYDMTYQVSGTYSWFNSPLYNGSTADATASSVDETISLFLGTGSTIPASKLMLSLPFYGYSYSNVRGPRQTTGSLGGQSNYSTLFNNYNLSSASFDNSAQVPWLATSNGYITFDNAQSIQAKVNYAQNKGLGGWMTFNLSADYLPSQNPQHPLLAAIASAMRNSTTAPPVTP
jgi:chitinase